MKTRTAILIAFVALLLLGSVALAQPDDRTSGTWFCVEPASAAAQGYRLTSVTLRQGFGKLNPSAQGSAWRVSGTASGGGYRLLEAPALTGSGCCCTYLPLIRR
jgi:hypothetical protein